MLAIALGWGLAPTPGHGQAVLLTASGNTGSQTGAVVRRVPDFDGDGQDDLLVGQPGANGSAGAVAVFSSSNGMPVASANGSQSLARFGTSLILLSDLTGDQVPEIAVGAPGAGGANPTGAIRILNGATLAQISSIPGATSQARLGEAMCRLDDQNNDGVPEFAAAAPGQDNGAILETGAVIVFDGASLTPLRQLFGAASFDSFGEGLSTIGDLNGDGQSELVIGSPGFDPPGLSGAGRLQVMDALTGLELRVFTGTSVNAAYGTSCAGLLDVNGDFVPDLAVGAPGDSTGATFGGGAEVRSGATGAVLNAVAGQFSGDRLGVMVASLGDIDRDGRGDYAIGSPFINANGLSDAGEVVVYTGRTHALLYLFQGPAAQQALGSHVSLLGDLDGDERDDFAIGSPQADGPGADAGRIEVRRSLTGAVEIDSTGQFGTFYSFTLQATPGATPFILVDTAQGSIQSAFGEICLSLSPMLLIARIPFVNPSGFSTFSGLLPITGLPPNTTLFMQCIVSDPNSFAGWRTSECASLKLIP